LEVFIPRYSSFQRLKSRISMRPFLSKSSANITMVGVGVKVGVAVGGTGVLVGVAVGGIGVGVRVGVGVGVRVGVGGIGVGVLEGVAVGGIGVGVLVGVGVNVGGTGVFVGVGVGLAIVNVAGVEPKGRAVSNPAAVTCALCIRTLPEPREVFIVRLIFPSGIVDGIIVLLIFTAVNRTVPLDVFITPSFKTFEKPVTTGVQVTD
jgi:hypothetical protein